MLCFRGFSASSEVGDSVGKLFARMRENRHENLMFFQHRDSGLAGVLAIHDSSLGPAIGGVRLWNYASEAEMVRDAMRLAESSSRTAALFGCDAGGGKAVVRGDPANKNEAMFRALGIYIDGLGGRFIASADMGTDADDMLAISKETRYVTGVPRCEAGDIDHSATTAQSVLLGMKAAANVRFGSAALAGRKVAVQGVGKVGLQLLALLMAEKARVYISDLYFDRVKAAKDQYSEVELVLPGEVLTAPVDILAPCANGDVITADNVESLRCAIIAGAASNQLADEALADRLAKRNILYAPDFVINGGELLMVNAAIYDISEARARRQLEQVQAMTGEIIRRSVDQGTTPLAVAHEMARERMRSVRTLTRLYRARPPRMAQWAFAAVDGSAKRQFRAVQKPRRSGGLA